MPALHYYPVVGGIETWTRNIAEKLSLKAEVFVVTGKVKGQPTQERSGQLRILRTSLFTLKNLSHSPLIYTLFLLPFIFWRSFILIKKEKINIMHCQGFLSSVLGFCLAEITGIPFIVTVQRLESKRNPLKNFIYRNATVCIGASRAIGDYFKTIGCKKVEIIPNGIDLGKFNDLHRQPHDEFIVITVARLEKVKGIEYLLQAAHQMKEVGPPSLKPVKFVIIGDGAERKNLESLADKLNLKEQVRFLGEIPNAKIPEYLAGADCFVLPSLKEGFGIVILEAQAAGIPVIGTSVGGILDLIEDGKNGLLVAPGDSDAIRKAVAKIASDLNLAQVLALNAKNNLIKYDWQNIADRVYQIYQQAL